MGETTALRMMSYTTEKQRKAWKVARLLSIQWAKALVTTTMAKLLFQLSTTNGKTSISRANLVSSIVLRPVMNGTSTIRHYDHDNPPPKIVQGYKFNIFYPD